MRNKMKKLVTSMMMLMMVFSLSFGTSVSTIDVSAKSSSTTEVKLSKYEKKLAKKTSQLPETKQLNMIKSARKKLNKKQQKAYDYVVNYKNQAGTFPKKFKLSNKDVRKIKKALDRDFGGFCYYDRSYFCINFTINKDKFIKSEPYPVITKKMINLAKAVQIPNATPRIVIAYLNCIRDNFDYEITDDLSLERYINMIKNKKGQCMHSAALTQFVCEMNNTECIYKANFKLNHAWNKVKLENGKWEEVDMTPTKPYLKTGYWKRGTEKELVIILCPAERLTNKEAKSMTREERQEHAKQLHQARAQYLPQARAIIQDSERVWTNMQAAVR